MLNDLDATLDQCQVQDGDYLLLMEGRVPPKVQINKFLIRLLRDVFQSSAKFLACANFDGMLLACMSVCPSITSRPKFRLEDNSYFGSMHIVTCHRGVGSSKPLTILPHASQYQVISGFLPEWQCHRLEALSQYGKTTQALHMSSSHYIILDAWDPGVWHTTIIITCVRRSALGQHRVAIFTVLYQNIYLLQGFLKISIWLYDSLQSCDRHDGGVLSWITSGISGT